MFIIHLRVFFWKFFIQISSTIQKQKYKQPINLEKWSWKVFNIFSPLENINKKYIELCKHCAYRQAG